MYICKHCNKKFEWAKVVREPHGKKSGVYERVLMCPHCDSTDFNEVKGGYCRNCGRKIPFGREYCNDTCRKAGEILWERQRKLSDERLRNAITKKLLEVDEYNKANKMNLSYGQYTAYIKGDN